MSYPALNFFRAWAHFLKREAQELSARNFAPSGAGGEAADIKAGHASGLAVPNMGAGSGAFSPQTFKNLLKVRIELVFREILHQ